MWKHHDVLVPRGPMNLAIQDIFGYYEQLNHWNHHQLCTQRLSPVLE